MGVAICSPRGSFLSVSEDGMMVLKGSGLHHASIQGCSPSFNIVLLLTMPSSAPAPEHATLACLALQHNTSQPCGNGDENGNGTLRDGVDGPSLHVMCACAFGLVNFMTTNL